MIKMRCTKGEALLALQKVEHQVFQNAIQNNWQYDKENKIKKQSICWLFCWAMTGMNSDNASRDAIVAFNYIFDISFESLKVLVKHDWARKARYCKNFEGLENTPKIFK